MCLTHFYIIAAYVLHSMCYTIGLLLTDIIVTVFKFFALGDSLNIHSRINLTQNLERCVNIKLLYFV